MNECRVGDVMTEHVITVKTSCDIRTAAHLFLRYRISGVPVVNSRKQLVGVITLDDLIAAVNFRTGDSQVPLEEVFKELEHRKVSSLMRKDFVTVTRRTTIEQAFRLAVKNNISTIPVIERNSLIGIIGMRDILNICLNEF
jgi:acetoin utilization protein AcuB